MKFSIDLDVKSYEVDSRSVIRPSVILQYMQEAMEKQMQKSDMGYKELFDKKRLAFIVSRMSIEIFKTIRQNDKLRVNTWCGMCKGAIYPRYYEILRGNDVCVRASSKWGLVGVDKKNILLDGEYDISAYPIDDEIKLVIPDRVRQPRDIEYKHISDIEVRYSKIDINKHINNTMYADLLYDFIPQIEEYNLTSMNFRFVHEARLGDVLSIYESDFMPPSVVDPKAEKIIYIHSKIGEKKNVEASFGLKKR